MKKMIVKAKMEMGNRNIRLCIFMGKADRSAFSLSKGIVPEGIFKIYVVGK